VTRRVTPGQHWAYYNSHSLTIVPGGNNWHKTIFTMKHSTKKSLAAFTTKKLTPEQQAEVKGGADFIGQEDIIES